MQSKKAQYFITDLIFSFVIVIVAVGIASYYMTSTIDETDIFDLNSQIMEQMSTTSVNSLNAPEIRFLFLENHITDGDNTIAQQAIEFYNNGEIEFAENLTRVFVGTYERRDVSIAVLFEEEGSTSGSEVIYESALASPFENAQTAYSSSRAILIPKDDDLLRYILTVRTWQ